MIVNLTKKIDFCNRKIEVIVSENRTHKLGVIWNSSCCSKGRPYKIVQLWQCLVIKLSFIFQF